MKQVVCKARGTPLHVQYAWHVLGVLLVKGVGRRARFVSVQLHFFELLLLVKCGNVGLPLLLLLLLQGIQVQPAASVLGGFI